nr:hypothetical protein Iba_chr14aCG24370 [Ipomoea batatas]
MHTSFSNLLNQSDTHEFKSTIRLTPSSDMTENSKGACTDLTPDTNVVLEELACVELAAELEKCGVNLRPPADRRSSQAEFSRVATRKYLYCALVTVHNSSDLSVFEAGKLFSEPRLQLYSPLPCRSSNNTECRLDGSRYSGCEGLSGKCLKLLLGIWKEIDQILVRQLTNFDALQQDSREVWRNTLGK